MNEIPTVGLKGLHGHNLGSILMGLAVRDQLPGVTLALPARVARPQLAKLLAPSGVWLWSEVAGHPTLHAVNHKLAQLVGNTALSPAPRKLQAVLDISGFSYGAPFNPRITTNLPQWIDIWARKGAPTVLLPQAFGPFPGQENRRSMALTLERVALVYARDDASAEALADLGRDVEIRRAPDLAIRSAMIHPSRSAPDTGGSPYALLLPNRQVVRKTEYPEHLYLDALVALAERCRSNGLDVVVASHEGTSDLALAQSISERVPTSRLIDDTSLDTILGAVRGAEVVISSRFHGLVAAFANGVPALSIGWAGKYNALLEDFGMKDFAVDVNREGERLGQSATSALEELIASRQMLGERILEARSLRLAELDDLWDTVRALVHAGEV